MVTKRNLIVLILALLLASCLPDDNYQRECTAYVRSYHQTAQGNLFCTESVPVPPTPAPIGIGG